VTGKGTEDTREKGGFKNATRRGKSFCTHIGATGMSIGGAQAHRADKRGKRKRKFLKAVLNFRDTSHRNVGDSDE